MSLNHLTDPLLNGVLNITCNSCDCKTAKIADSLEVRDFTFDALNGDKIELSTLENKGTFGAVLKSDGNNGVLWGSDLTGNLEYNGTLPTADGVLSLYSGIDGTTVRNSTLTETDLLNTENKANTNESDILNIQTDITDLQNDKLSLDGTLLMTGPLQLGGNNITGVLNITSSNVYSNINTLSISGLLDQDIGINNNTRYNNNNIENVNNLQTNEIRATGNSVNIKDDVNMGFYDINNINEIKTNNIATNSLTDITFISPVNLNSNNITNVNNLQTQEIKATDGVSINIQDDINMGLYDINNCNEIKTNALSTNTAPNIVSNNNIDMNNNDLLNVGNMNVSTINNITACGGLYAGTSDGVIINQASGPTDLLPLSSVGSLSIPANGFQVGNCFHLVVAGIFPSENKADDITIVVRQDGTTIASINLELENFDTEPSNFELEMDFVVRSVGVAGVIASNADFSYNRRVNSDFKGTRSTDITVIDTTTPSTLSVLATVNGASSSIQSRLAYLRKQY